MHIVHAHIHTLKAALWFWQWIRGCCLEALLNHNNISNPLSLLCAGVWCVLLALNSSVGVNEVPEAMNYDEPKKMIHKNPEKGYFS